MNEEVYTTNQNQPIPSTPPDTPAQPPMHPSYKIGNWIVLIYIVMVTLGFIISVSDPDPTLSIIMFWAVLIIGAVAGISFLVKMAHHAKTSSPVVQIFSVIVGIGGGFVIFVIAFVAALTGYFAGNPIQGD